MILRGPEANLDTGTTPANLAAVTSFDDEACTKRLSCVVTGALVAMARTGNWLRTDIAGRPGSAIFVACIMSKRYGHASRISSAQAVRRRLPNFAKAAILGS